MGPKRVERPANYLNQEAYLNAYLAYYLPLHLPELFWILDQGKARNYSFSTQRVLDVGAGPGTLSLSLLFWLQKEGLPMPEEIVLWDQSERALKFAKDKIRLISPATRVRFEKIHLPKTLRDDNFDLILAGHLLNEWGAGPRFRAKKVALLGELAKFLKPSGSLVVIEPPLKEPTLDLMAARDELAPHFEIIAPCPQSHAGCPMLRDRAGWCYAQPPRNLFQPFGFTEYDRQIERLLSIRLSQQSFSYLWLAPKNATLAPVATYVTDPQARPSLLCISEGKLKPQKENSEYRGQHLL